MPKLTDNEVEEFLSERGHLARIGTVDADGMPRVLPLWFIIRDDELLFTPRSPAIIWKNIERDPRVGISIDEEADPWRKVSVQGHVVVKYQPGNDDAWREIYRDKDGNVLIGALDGVVRDRIRMALNGHAMVTVILQLRGKRATLGCRHA